VHLVVAMTTADRVSQSRVCGCAGVR